MGSLAFRAYDVNLRRVYMAEFIEYCILADNPRPFRASLVSNPLAQTPGNDPRTALVWPTRLGHE